MKSRGFTLIEILLATLILGTGLLVIFSGLTPCLAMVAAAKRLQEVRWVVGLGQLRHPVAAFDEPGALVVEEDGSLADGYVFSRTIDEKEVDEDGVDDGLYVMRTCVSWGEGDDASEEIVQLVWKRDGGGYSP